MRQKARTPGQSVVIPDFAVESSWTNTTAVLFLYLSNLCTESVITSFEAAPAPVDTYAHHVCTSGPTTRGAHLDV